MPLAALLLNAHITAKLRASYAILFQHLVHSLNNIKRNMYIQLQAGPPRNTVKFFCKIS